MAQTKKFESLLKKHSRVGIDSSVFIYLFEQHPDYEPLCAVIFDTISSGHLRLISASITLSEVLVRPLEQKNAEIVALYEHAFRSMPNFSLVQIDYTVAKTAALLRANYSILLPDALHIACALKEGATLFVTNDMKLKRISDISIACLSDYA